MTDLTRRDLLRGLGIAAGAATAVSLAPGQLLDAADAVAASPPSTPSMTPDAALTRLAAGNRRFVNGRLRHPRRD
ncbi:MAG: hypothetical protein QOF40_2724, partial [Actinomycetota bacterium]|nr:hypothetical protein [Actinomycetota bacterium]